MVESLTLQMCLTLEIWMMYLCQNKLFRAAHPVATFHWLLLFLLSNSAGDNTWQFYLFVFFKFLRLVSIDKWCYFVLYFFACDSIPSQPIRLIKGLSFDFLKLRCAGWTDWLGKKCRKYLEHLFLKLSITMPVIWWNIAALGSCQEIVLIFILASRFVD